MMHFFGLRNLINRIERMIVGLGLFQRLIESMNLINRIESTSSSPLNPNFLKANLINRIESHSKCDRVIQLYNYTMESNK